MKVLILPDTKGWAMDRIADGLISIFPDVEWDKKYYDREEYQRINWGIYDVCYVMIADCLPKGEHDFERFRVSFHGGPFVERQARHLVNTGLSNRVRLSSVDAQSVRRLRAIGIELKCDFTPYGIDTNHFKPDLKKKSRNTFTCGWAGWAGYLMNKQAYQRRGYWIMEAWDELNNGALDGFRLKIAGGLSRFPEQVEMFNKLFPKIDCKCYEPEQMVAYYNSLDVYLAPDRQAGGPIPVLEAGACGVPIVFTDCGFCGDFLIPDVHGIRVLTYEEFRDAIVTLAGDRAKCKKMGALLQRDLAGHRTWEAVKQYWENFLFK